MMTPISIKFGLLSCFLNFVCNAGPIRIGPHLPDAYAFGMSPEDDVYIENDDNLHGNDGASKYINLGQGPKMVAVDGPPMRIQGELREAMEAAEAKRTGVAAPEQPDIKGSKIKTKSANKGKDRKVEASKEELNEDNIPDTEKASFRTLGRMLSSTDYESSQFDYDIDTEAAEIWEQIGRIARKFQEKSKKMKDDLSNVKDRKAAAAELHKEVVGQLAELSVSLSETYPFGNKDGLLEKLGAAKNTIKQNIDTILLGYNLHYDKDNL